ncbi:phenylalanine--tRNA ligase subunit beta [Aeromicrobium sp.]|uniref:phenylalanine--tRNA ligase subunit beta n=1 Tax=Aeromicrobium sp. TaxID=1871063 RepID=UPI001982AE7A|nr:phenylalanine--tRNA ligase subunit beta [Aeromicrobium sp.]MBC7633213.1 phenylalanine--tRNA ligase subunit beta [Aeromicrobium sp.]
MRVPVEWLRQYVDLPDDLSTEALAARLTAFDLKLEEIIGSGISGPLTVGRVLTLVGEPQKNGKTINWCRVDVGAAHNDPPVSDPDGVEMAAGRGIVCGAHNFVVGDLVVVSLPGTVLPALGFEITARKTYGHVSDGMICSGAELGLAGDADGIMVLEPGTAEPGDDAIVLLGLDGDVLDLEVNPDRAYALSLRGVARDSAIAFDVPFHDPADTVDEVVSTGTSYPVRVEDAFAAPVFVTREITGFDPSRPSPGWLVRRLEQAGMRSISLAVDISNYVMLELGQPNHAYDRAKLRGGIVVRRAVEGEKITTLDDVVRTLDPDDLLITDDRGPIGIAGVMGSADVEIDGTTTDIVIESAYFDPKTIFRAARRHRIPSEASKRNERGIDSSLQPRAATRVAQLMAELGGGVVSGTMTVVGESPASPHIRLRVDLPSRVTGVEIDAVASVEALEANGCSVEMDHEWLTVTPPPWRPDLTDPYDVVEEVLRVVGYDKVPSILPPAPAGRGLTKAQKLRRRVGNVLAGDGLIEVKTFPFAGEADWDRMGLLPDDVRRTQVLLENPLSAEEPGMTTTVLTGLLRSLVLNIGRGHSDVSIVETGRVFLPRSDVATAPIYGVADRPGPGEFAVFDAVLPAQPLHVGLLMSGERVRTGWAGPGRHVMWADAVAVVQHVAEVLHVDLAVEQVQLAPWHPGRCAAFVLDGVTIGHAGELHPRVLKAYGLPARVVAAEVDLDALVDASPEIGPRPDFSAFPVAKEDLALVVDGSVLSGDLQAVLAGASTLIESARLFDVYTGDQVPAGKKSLAFALRLRAPDRTLTEEDIRGAREAAVDAARRVSGAILRT